MLRIKHIFYSFFFPPESSMGSSQLFSIITALSPIHFTRSCRASQSLFFCLLFFEGRFWPCVCVLVLVKFFSFTFLFFSSAYMFSHLALVSTLSQLDEKKNIIIKVYTLAEASTQRSKALLFSGCRRRRADMYMYKKRTQKEYQLKKTKNGRESREKSKEEICPLVNDLTHCTKAFISVLRVFHSLLSLLELNIDVYYILYRSA